MTSNRSLFSQRFFMRNLLSLAVAGTFLYAPIAGASYWKVIGPTGEARDHEMQVQKLGNADAPAADTLTINGNLTVRPVVPNGGITRLDATQNLSLTVKGNLTGGVLSGGAVPEEKIYLILDALDVSGNANVNNRFSANTVKVGGDLTAGWTLSVGDYNKSGESTVGGRLTTGQLDIAPSHQLTVDSAKVTEYVNGNITSKHGMELAGVNRGNIVTLDGDLTLGNDAVKGDESNIKNLTVNGNLLSKMNLNVAEEMLVTGTGKIDVTGNLKARNIAATGEVKVSGDTQAQTIKLGAGATFGGNVDCVEQGYLTVGGNTTIGGSVTHVGGLSSKGQLPAGHYTVSVDKDATVNFIELNSNEPNIVTFDLNVGGQLNAVAVDAVKNLKVGKDLNVKHFEYQDRSGLVKTTGLLTVGGNMKAKDVNIAGGSIEGRLAATTLSVTDAPLTIKGATIAGTGIQLERNTLSTVTLDKAGASSIAGGLTVNQLDILNGTVLTVDDLALVDNKSVVHVGKSTDKIGGAKLIAEKADLKGGSIILDPDYTLADTQAAFGSLTGSGQIVVGQNSQLTLGSTDTAWLDAAVNEHTNNAGLTAGGMTAAIGITGNVKIPSGYAITVDGTVTSGSTPAAGTAGSINFKTGSLTVVDARAASAGSISFVDTAGNAVNGSINVASGAKLHLDGIQPGASVQLFDPAKINANNTTWTTVTTDNALVQIDRIDPTTGSVSASGSASTVTMPELSKGLGDILVNATNANAIAANAFAKAALDTSPGRHNARTGAAALEGAARMAALAGVPQVTLLASEIVSDIAIEQVRREGMRGATVSSEGRPDHSLWAAPIYRKAKADDLATGAFKYNWDTDVSGIVVGGDATFRPNFRLGWQFNAGEASTDTDGDFMKTENDAEFWGLGMYANWRATDAIDVTTDLALTMVDNELDQAVVPTIGKALSANVDSRAVTFGVRADWRFETAYGRVTPYAGLRFTDLHTDDFGVMQGAAVMTAESVDQQLWTFPVGVAWTRDDLNAGGWAVMPKVDLAVIAAAGDTDAESKVRFTGLAGNASLDTEVMDDVTGALKLGLTMKKDNFAVGFDYACRLGADTESHRLNASVNWLF